jgi:hypothetical protein
METVGAQCCQIAPYTIGAATIGYFAINKFLYIATPYDLQLLRFTRFH